MGQSYKKKKKKKSIMGQSPQRTLRRMRGVNEALDVSHKPILKSKKSTITPNLKPTQGNDIYMPLGIIFCESIELCVLSQCI